MSVGTGNTCDGVVYAVESKWLLFKVIDARERGIIRLWELADVLNERE